MSSHKPPTKLQVRIALGLTALLLFGIVCSNTILNNPLGFDFSPIYAAATILHQGKGSKLYNIEEQSRVEKSFGRNKILIYDHPPFEAILFEPIAKLSYTGAYVLWGAVNVLLWLLFLSVLRPFAPVPRMDLHYFMLCSLFFPIWSALMQGQTSILLLVSFSLTFVLLERHKDYQAGIFLGLGLFKFPLVLPFAAICFLRSKWKMMMGFATAATLLAALSFLAVGPAGVISYIRMLAAAAGKSSALPYATLKPWEMPTLTSFLMTFLVPSVSPRLVAIAAAVLGGILVLITAGIWRYHEKSAAGNSSGLMFAGALTVSLITSPYLNVHDLSLMLIAVLLVLGSPQWASRSPWAKILTACIWILYFPPAYLFLLRHGKMSLLFPVLLCFTLAAFILAANPSPRKPLPQSVAETDATAGAEPVAATDPLPQG